MTRPVRRTALAACCALAVTLWIGGGAPMSVAVAARQSTSQQPQQDQRPVFRGGTSLVTVDVYPQHDGVIVPDLSADDFQVFEDGVPQRVENFEFIRIEPGLVDAERRDPNTQEEGFTLAADPKNRAFVLYLDSLNVTVDGSYRARKPLVAMLNELLAPNDLFAVMTPLLRPSDLIFGRKTQSIEDQLARWWPWGQRQTTGTRDQEEELIFNCFHQPPPPDPSPVWMVPDGAVIRPLVDVLTERKREAQTLESLQRLVDYLGSMREARTDLIVLTDGWLLARPDNGLLGLNAKVGGATPTVGILPGGRLGTAAGAGYTDAAGCSTELTRLANLDDEQAFRRLIQQANRSNVTFYPVAPGGLQAFDSSIADEIYVNPGSNESILMRETNRLRDRSGSLRTIASNTDGVAIVDTNDLDGGLKRIVNDVSAYYLLGYYSTNPKPDGKFRKIDVKVARPGLKVRARRGYLAPTEDALRAADASAAAAPTGPSPVDNALDVLSRLRPSADLHSLGTATATTLSVVAEIASGATEGGHWAKGGTVHASVSGAEGPALSAEGVIEPGARGALLRVPLPPDSKGPWRVTLQVDGDDGSLRDAFDVLPPADDLLGAPIVFRGTPAPRIPLRAVADFQFRRTERIHVEWPIVAPLDRREGRLLGRDGRALAVPVALTERDVDGQATLAADVNLAPLTEGDYVIEVTAGAADKSARSLVPLRLIR